uniref:Uncharacterized protein n=1 Tax=Knipowitschia caucasica TaxID=637954 RepID=A0AAV2MQY5_KNICA
MCWLPIDQPLLMPRHSSLSRSPSPCSMAQVVASRLRRVGDQFEKSFASGATEYTSVRFGGKRHLRSALWSLAALLLLFTRRHL